MITKRSFDAGYDDGYDDPYKQENKCVKCFTWGRGNINGLCISSIFFTFVGIALLVTLAAWSYISTLTSLDHVKTDHPKLYSSRYSSKSDIPTYRNRPAEFNDYITDTLQNDHMQDSEPSTALGGGQGYPDIVPVMGSSAAIPDTPFHMPPGVDKPYVIPAQPNDLNLDLI